MHNLNRNSIFSNIKKKKKKSGQLFEDPIFRFMFAH